MNDWFEWNGERCTRYGLYVTEQPPLVRATERATFTAVPGRSGSLTTLEGEDVYDDLLLTATCVVANPDRIPAIAAWLRGGGTVTFANRRGGYYHARIVNQLSFEKILRGNPHRRFAVNFRCQPYWYHEPVPDIVAATSGITVTNPGNVFAEPILRITGAGDISLMVGMTMFDLSGLNGSVTVDTPLMEVYDGFVSRNSLMSGEFPLLRPGTNGVSWFGNVSSLTITPNWRSL